MIPNHFNELFHSDVTVRFFFNEGNMSKHIFSYIDNQNSQVMQQQILSLPNGNNFLNFS
jgi:hypothetical protein